MTLDRSIEILKLLDFKRIRLFSHKEMDAIHLSIEALKAVKNTRLIVLIGPIPPLPGETEE